MSEDKERSSSARHLFVYAGTDGKAGMQGMDENKQLEVISKFSRGSAYNKHAEKQDAQHDEPIKKLIAKSEGMSVADVTKYNKKAEAEVQRLEGTRSFARHIVVIDFDAFYAKVEQRDNPELQGKPIAVGGGVITTASYEARKFGVRSAMHSGVALQLCPQLIIVDCHFDKYKEASQQMRNVVLQYDPHPSMCSLDEIIFDITDAAEVRMREDGRVEDISSPSMMRALVVDMVEEIRAKINAETRLTVSAGIANNSTLAKICSNTNKPDGQFSLNPNREAVLAFLGTLTVRKYPGIGRVSEKYLTSLGLKTFGDVRAKLGKVMYLFGGLEKTSFLLGASLGIKKQEGVKVTQDNLPESAVTRKSIGVERTFRTIYSTNDFMDTVDRLSTSLAKDMVTRGLWARTLTVKVKTSKYDVSSKAATTDAYFQSKERIFSLAHKLMTKMLEDSKGELNLAGLRLIGLSARKFKNAVSTQEREQAKHGQHRLDAFLRVPQRQAVPSETAPSREVRLVGEGAGEGLTMDNPVLLLSSQSDPEEEDEEEDEEWSRGMREGAEGAPIEREEGEGLVTSSSSARVRAEFAHDFFPGEGEDGEEDEDHLSDLHAMASSALVMEHIAKRQRLA